MEGESPTLNIEVDESLFNRRKNHQGHQLPQQCVSGGIFWETHGCFIYTIPDKEALILLPIMQGSTWPCFTIISDLWATYECIQATSHIHLTVNHTFEFVDPVTGNHTQNVEN